MSLLHTPSTTARTRLNALYSPLNGPLSRNILSSTFDPASFSLVPTRCEREGGEAALPEEFKLEAVKQITERGHKVADASARIGVSQHSLYKWIKTHRVPA
ncbi:MAG: transposase, partial [Rubrivivax sp.]